MYNRKGLLIVISGFSGAGKGTVVKKMMEKYDYALSISSTTRNPRVGEEHGEHYFFLETEDFQGKIKENQFLEWAKYCENYYGTPKEFVFQQMEEGKDIILEIEAQGALKVKEQYDEAILVFLTAPSAKELKQRLTGRGTESTEAIDKRIQRAYEETDIINKYNYFIVNEDVEQCADDIHTFVRAEHYKPLNRVDFVNQLKGQFEEILAQ